jgi:hypothetical protein
MKQVRGPLERSVLNYLSCLDGYLRRWTSQNLVTPRCGR